MTSNPPVASRSLKRYAFGSVALLVLLLSIWAGVQYHRTTTPGTEDAVQAWESARSQFVSDYEHEHGTVDASTQRWLFSNAHRMCWWLLERPRLPQQALQYGTTTLGMSADQASTVTELGMKYVIGCPNYNLRR